jgi:hypothetical protein
MALFTEKILEDGFWVVILILVFAFFRFHHHDRRWKSGRNEKFIERRKSRSTQAGKKAA